MARFGDVDITALSTQITSKKYTFDVWLYIQTYNTGKFGNYSFEWNRYLKIKLGYANGSYTSTCYPLFERTQTAYENSNSETINFVTETLPWVYLRCSVDIEKKLYFHYHQTLFTRERTLQTTLTDIISTGTVSLKFVNENQNRGILFFRLLRLFKCYDCQIPDMYRLNWITPAVIGDQISNEDLLYHIDGKIIGYNTIDRSDIDAEQKQKIAFIKDTDGTVTQTAFITALTSSQFLGYNVVDLTASKYKPLFTPKSTNNLYPEGTYLWSGLLKLNELEDVRVPDVLPSYTGRYTMEFWFMITDVAKLTQGVHIIWKNLVSVTLVQDSTDNTKLNMFCWPQDFKLNAEINADLMNTYGAANIQNLVSDSRILNYERKQRSSSINNTWIYVRCAFNGSEKTFYSIFEDVTPGTPTEITVKSEFMYTYSSTTNQKISTSNDYPFRYFFQNAEKTSLYFSGMSKNTNCVFYLRNIWLFDDYLPKNMDFRHV